MPLPPYLHELLGIPHPQPSHDCSFSHPLVCQLVFKSANLVAEIGQLDSQIDQLVANLIDLVSKSANLLTQISQLLPKSANLYHHLGLGFRV